MSKNVIQSIVIILAIFIAIAFLFLIYGMYLKISTSSDSLLKIPSNLSINLTKDQSIKDIQVINNDNLLILIQDGEYLKGGIYDVNKNKITHFINR
jgi:hypothetical protein